MEPSFGSADEKTWWTKVGRALGYPECCIAEFGLYFPTSRQKSAAESTGFIPCPQCTEKVLSRELHLEDLITNRNPALPPFPKAWNVRDMLQHIEGN
jgi:hypothetical protein